MYVDQKHNARKKLSNNKASIRKTGGGPNEEVMLSTTEEKIVEAAGLTAAVVGIAGAKCFGGKTTTTVEVSEGQEVTDVDEYEAEYLSLSESEFTTKENDANNTPTPRKQTNHAKPSSKTDLLENNINIMKDWHTEIGKKLNKVMELKEKSLKLKEEHNKKLDKLISLNERELRLKEIEHSSNMSTKELDLKIRTLELEVLQQNSLHTP